MKANIFNHQDYEKIVERITTLTSDSRRKWGKMNGAQMLEHCSIQLKLGLGELGQKRYEGPSIQRTWFGRWLILYAIPWPHGLPTPSRMNILKNQIEVAEFEVEKKQLRTLLEKIMQTSNLQPHPFFGAMNIKDWGRLIWKHLDHHLRQFGR